MNNEFEIGQRHTCIRMLPKIMFIKNAIKWPKVSNGNKLIILLITKVYGEKWQNVTEFEQKHLLYDEVNLFQVSNNKL